MQTEAEERLRIRLENQSIFSQIADLGMSCGEGVVVLVGRVV